MLNVAICEDCPLQTEVIQALLDKYQSEKADVQLLTQSFASGRDLLAQMNSGRRFDLFLLDILMPGQSGIELARELRIRDEGAPLIFLTASSEYTLEAFGVWAVQYILKPVTESKLFPVLDRVISTIRPEEEKVFILSTPGRIVYIPFPAISHAELVGRTLQITQCDGKAMLSNSIRVPFSEAVEPLLEDSRFLSPHISFVVNMTQIKELGRASFTMKNGIQVPIPRHKYTAVKEKYLAFLKEREGGAAKNPGRE